MQLVLSLKHSSNMASFLHLVSLIFVFTASLALKIPKLGLYENSYKTMKTLDTEMSEYNVYNYTQTLDHFNFYPESYATFQQRYAINWKYWGGAKNNSPIFVYTGDESELEGDLSVGFMLDNAAHFHALLVVVEHRYYGQSNPFGSKEEAYRNSSTLGYFSSTQALADYAQLITDLKKNLTAKDCPVIALGGSYGGMLASWFRLKYPHIVIGAFASSAPILYFDDITPHDGYINVVAKDFQEASESCYTTIKQSWSDIQKIAAQTNGLDLLSQIFHTCWPLNNTDQLIEVLADRYYASAQYDAPPKYPVNALCSAIDGAAEGATVLERIYAGVRSTSNSCMELYDDADPTTETTFGWFLQTCMDMVMPIGSDSNDSMFPRQPFDLKNYTMDCQKNFGLTPRPNWITTEFGGLNIKSVLKNFGSNIIFSNGLRDPYSSGGVLYNISNSIVAIYTAQGSHCLDLHGSKPDDPDWLIAQRNAEIQIIDGWIEEYNANLIANISQ